MLSEQLICWHTLCPSSPTSLQGMRGPWRPDTAQVSKCWKEKVLQCRSWMGEEPAGTGLLLGKNIHGSGGDVDFESSSCFFIFLVPLSSSLPTQGSPGDHCCVLSFRARRSVGSCLISLQLLLCSLLGLWCELALSVAQTTPNSSFPHSSQGRGEAYGLFVWNLLGKVPCDLAVHCCCWLYDARLFWSHSRLKPLDGFAPFSWSFIIYNEWKQTWRITLQSISSNACCLLHWNHSETKQGFFSLVVR